MKIFDTQIEDYYSQYFGWVYRCYKFKGSQKGNVCYCSTIWEVIQFIWD